MGPVVVKTVVRINYNEDMVPGTEEPLREAKALPFTCCHLWSWEHHPGDSPLINTKLQFLED